MRWASIFRTGYTALLLVVSLNGEKFHSDSAARWQTRMTKTRRMEGGAGWVADERAAGR